MGSSVDAMEMEIHNQIEDLPRQAEMLRKEARRLNPENTVFTGSGDSYAVALFAQELSRGAAVARDPYELYKNPAVARNKTLVVVSVSGRTRTNFRLARKLRKIAKKTIAITSDQNSPLARSCSETLLLKYRKSGVLTPGTSSFTSCLLACSSLITPLPTRILLSEALRAARKFSGTVRATANSAFFLTGSGLAYPLALYGACKFKEVLGAKTEAVYPEQLGHAQLFSIDARKDEVLSIDWGRDRRTQGVSDALSRAGFRIYSVMGFSSNPILRALETTFHLQMTPLSLARRRRLKECAFVNDKEKLDLSSSLIY